MIRSLTLAALAATTVVVSAASKELRDTANKVAATSKDSVVWLSVLSKTTMSADGDAPAQVKSALANQQDREAKSEALGTVIDNSGLIVTALGAIDRGSLLDGQTTNTQLGPIKIKAATEFKEIKVITADGSEVPADLVFKDEDLGLAFIKVRSESDEAKGIEFKAINIADAGKGELLQDCFVLKRLDESFNREASMESGEITAITTRPRTFYGGVGGHTGCPVFLDNGKLLGVGVLRRGPKSGSGQIQMGSVILPAADLAKSLAQAKSAKPETPVKPATTEAKEAESKEGASK